MKLLVYLRDRHSPLNFKTGLDTTWQDDLIFYVGWFVIVGVILAPLFGLVVLLDWLVIPD